MNHSERVCFNNCPQKYKWQKEHLRPLTMSFNAEDRNFGIAIHEGLKAFYDGGDWAKIEKAFSSSYPREKEYKTQAKSHESGILTLKAYIEYWREQDKQWEVLGTEVADIVEFNYEEHGLHIDLIARHRQTDEIWAWDHKTTDKPLGKGFWKKYELDSQVTRYTKYVADKYGSCGGFIINGIQVGHRKRAYMGEPAGYHQHFERQPFSRSKQQIEFWMKSEKEWQTLIQFCEEMNNYPKHLGSLCGYCDYYALCLSSDNESVKETMFTTEPLDEPINIIDETK